MASFLSSRPGLSLAAADMSSFSCPQLASNERKAGREPTANSDRVSPDSDFQLGACQALIEDIDPCSPTTVAGDAALFAV